MRRSLGVSSLLRPRRGFCQILFLSVHLDGGFRSLVLGRLGQSLCARRGSLQLGGGCNLLPSGLEACRRHRVVWRVWDLP